MPKLTFEQKRERIKELENIIAEKTEELRQLIDPQEKEPALPVSFSVNEKVLEAIKDHTEGISKKEIIKVIKDNQGVELPSVKVQAAISSLKYHKKIEIIGRATYKAI